MTVLTRTIRAVTGVVVLVVALVGIPAGLLVAGAQFFPAFLTDPGQLWASLNGNSARLFLALIAVIGLVLCVYAWVAFTVAVLVEITAQLKRVHPPRLPTLGWAQAAAAVILGLIVVASPVAQIAATASTWEPGAPTGPTAVSVATTLGTPPAAVPAAPTPAIESVQTTTTRPPVAAIADTPAPVVTTVRGDSLWRLATQHLGDPLRWREIAALNTDRVQPDGRTLDVDKPLQPNWTLVLPTDATGTTPAPTPGVGERAVTVQAGDTLWGIAETETGDPQEWDEIAAATADVRQPDGTRLTDPDVIDVGWTVLVPDAQGAAAPGAPPAAESPVPTPTPAPPVPDTAAPPSAASPGDAAEGDQEQGEAEQGQAPALPGVTAAPVPVRPPADARPPTGPSEAGQGRTDPSPRTSSPTGVPVASSDANAGWVHLDELSAVGGLFAAVVLAAVGTRRMVRRRGRRLGHRFASSDGLSDTELALRTAEDPATVALLDSALRTWSARHTGAELPDVLGAVIGDATIMLLLATAAPASSPFMAGPGPTLWRLDPADTLEDETSALAPFPTLVTIGHTPAGETILIDLERAGALTLHGEDSDVADVLSAMAVELACSGWADHLDVTVVGLPPELAATLPTGRLRHADTLDEVLDRMHRHRTEVDAAFAESDASTALDARIRGVADEAWIPEVLLSAHPVTAVQQQRLRTISSGRANLAAVITAAGDDPMPGHWVIDVPPTGTTTIPVLGATVELQRLSAAARAGVLAEFTAAERTDQLPGPDAELIPTEPTGPTPVPELEDAAGDTGSSDEEQVGERELATLLAVNPGAPMVRVLRPVPDVTGVGPYTGDAASKVLELVVLMALRPGLRRVQVAEIMGTSDEGAWAEATCRMRLSAARGWLGADPDGADFVLRASPTSGFRLSPTVDTDYARFERLSTRGLRMGEAGLVVLDAALALVDGVPLKGVPHDRYSFAVADRQEWINRVVDVAHTASVGHMARQPRRARSAAELGLSLDAANETLFRDLFRAEFACRNHAGIQAGARRLRVEVDRLGVEIEPETIALLDELLQTRPRTSRAAS